MRLAGAVRADDADDAAGRQVERQVVDQQRVAEALAQVLGLDHDVAEARPRRDVDLDLVDLLLRVLVEQLLVGVEARLALGLAGPRRQPDPLQLALQRALAPALGLLLEREPLLLLLEPRRVVAFPRDAAAAIELEDPAGDVVEEVAIVRDRDDRARVVLEVLLEPGHRLGVEVVGRLVEEQQVGLLQQQPAQRDAAALAAGELRHRRVGRRAAQRVHRELELRVEIPGVQRVDAILDLALLLEDLVHLLGRQVLAELGVDLVEADEERARRGDAFVDDLAAPSSPDRACGSCGR